ncbi:tripartite tricarboxylate transporter TctB family protein [Brevibacillus composti]|uniref:Tripartite tricarboxylate transporter TctB family protein n=1 Tax=Brevibacillus composti TaxID=2796470 RepID=A0A7T5ELI6_9BACL|nr:tripartite tricarboxylate transporter TctB family protein [Brevibacillus composti]QQE74831.1 tripartite tricarboxylate transporter TctB family protein [Brevibacillus composti]QUO41915.1 tripartite tricarboxylate transporter TctB family protein [Brevibacillus composti]
MSKTFDRYASIVFLAMGVAFVIGSMGISQSAYGSKVGPNIFPLGLGSILVLLSIRLFFETFRYQSGQKQAYKLDYKRFGIILSAAVLYALFLRDVGYVIGTFLFLLIGFQTMEKGKWLSSILISGGFSFGVHYVYVELLEGTLPGFPAWLGL